MRSRVKRVMAAAMLMTGGLLVGCDIEGSSSTTDRVDELIQQSQAAEQAEAVAEQAGTSSTSGQTASSEPARSTPTVASAEVSGASAGGFVWKPVSESDGNAVVLLPPAYAGRATSCTIVRGGATVEGGRFVGNTNGNRPTFRFRQPGAGYGTNLSVVARFSDGTSRSWAIPSGGSRVG